MRGTLLVPKQPIDALLMGVQDIILAHSAFVVTDMKKAVYEAFGDYLLFTATQTMTHEMLKYLVDEYLIGTLANENTRHRLHGYVGEQFMNASRYITGGLSGLLYQMGQTGAVVDDVMLIDTHDPKLLMVVVEMASTTEDALVVNTEFGQLIQDYPTEHRIKQGTWPGYGPRTNYTVMKPGYA